MVWDEDYRLLMADSLALNPLSTTDQTVCSSARNFISLCTRFLIWKMYIILSTSQKNIYKVFRIVPGTLKSFSVKMSIIKQEIIDIGGQQALKFQFLSFILHI